MSPIESAEDVIKDVLSNMPPESLAQNGRVIREPLSLYEIKQRLDEHGLHMTLDHTQRVLNNMIRGGSVELVAGEDHEHYYTWAGVRGYDLTNILDRAA